MIYTARNTHHAVGECRCDDSTGLGDEPCPGGTGDLKANRFHGRRGEVIQAKLKPCDQEASRHRARKPSCHPLA